MVWCKIDKNYHMNPTPPSTAPPFISLYILNMYEVLQSLSNVEVFTIVDSVGDVGQSHFLLVCPTNIKILQNKS